MKNIYKSSGSALLRLSELDEDCWVNLVAPDETEMKNLSLDLGIPYDFLSDPLDVDERARMEIDENVILIILKVPVRNLDNDDVPFLTLPVGIILKDNVIVTVCSAPNTVVDDFIAGKVKSFSTRNKTQFVIQIFHKTSILYLRYLKELNLKTSHIEDELERSMKNAELIKLLNIEKCLVFFVTSLKANEIIMERIMRTDVLKITEEVKDLLDDTITENKQAIEMTNIYSNILSGMMDAFASIISNNMNTVMKFLTSVTIVLMIPNLFAGIYGMNVQLPLQDSPYAFPLIMAASVSITLIGIWVFIKQRWF